jgi:hypothetical protein
MIKEENRNEDDLSTPRSNTPFKVSLQRVL